MLKVLIFLSIITEGENKYRKGVYIMIRVEPITTNTDNTYNTNLENQFIQRLKLLDDIKSRSTKVAENQKTATKDKVRDDRKNELEDNNKKKATFIGNKIKFQVDNETGKVAMQIVDPETGKIIRVIPQELMKKEMSSIYNGEHFIDQKV